MKKLKIEDDGSLGYSFDKKDLKELILEKYPELIDDKHMFDEIDIGRNDIAITIKRICCGKLIYPNDTIKCGEWSGGDQHYCKECFAKQEVSE